MNITEVYPSKYLKADDLNGMTVNVTIKFVCMESMMGNDKKNVDKPVIYFNEYLKGLVMNKTNSKAITALYGKETELWKNKPVRLSIVQIDAFGEVTDAIRISKPIPTAEPAKTIAEVDQPQPGF